MAAEEGDVISFIFTGVAGEVIPRDATRFIAHESVTVIPLRLCLEHPNIVELICHAGVERIEKFAFTRCRRLKRVIIPGVKVVEGYAFLGCNALNYIECPKLERMGGSAFEGCNSLSDINLPSAQIVGDGAFLNLNFAALTNVKFGKNLESIEGRAFCNCLSLERLTIPLKDGLFAEDNTFTGCENLNSVDLVEGAVLRETIAALLLEEWRNDMSAKINYINEILPNTPAGDGWFVRGGKARAIREWIERVLRKIIHYKAQHRHLLNEAATSLMHALPNDIVINSVLPFLHLPSHMFEGEDDDVDLDSSSSSDDTEESYDTSDGSDDDEGGDEDDDRSNNSDESCNKSEGEEENNYGSRGEEEEDNDSVEEEEEDDVNERRRKRKKTSNDKGIAY